MEGVLCRVISILCRVIIARLITLHNVVQDPDWFYRVMSLQVLFSIILPFIFILQLNIFESYLSNIHMKYVKELFHMRNSVCFLHIRLVISIQMTPSQMTNLIFTYLFYLIFIWSSPPLVSRKSRKCSRKSRIGKKT